MTLQAVEVCVEDDSLFNDESRLSPATCDVELIPFVAVLVFVCFPFVLYKPFVDYFLAANISEVESECCLVSVLAMFPVVFPNHVPNCMWFDAGCMHDFPSELLDLPVFGV